jgi:hypothetical protein
LFILTLAALGVAGGLFGGLYYVWREHLKLRSEVLGLQQELASLKARVESDSAAAAKDSANLKESVNMRMDQVTALLNTQHESLEV